MEKEHQASLSRLLFLILLISVYFFPAIPESPIALGLILNLLMMLTAHVLGQSSSTLP
jgi:hypothetical protein